MLKFERDIPIPPKNDKTGGSPGKGWALMQVGDTVLLPDRKRSQIHGTLLHLRKRYGFECEARNVEGGVRIWRVK